MVSHDFNRVRYLDNIQCLEHHGISIRYHNQANHQFFAQRGLHSSDQLKPFDVSIYNGHEIIKKLFAQKLQEPFSVWDLSSGGDTGRLSFLQDTPEISNGLIKAFFDIYLRLPLKLFFGQGDIRSAL